MSEVIRELENVLVLEGYLSFIITHDSVQLDHERVLGVSAVYTASTNRPRRIQTLSLPRHQLRQKWRHTTVTTDKNTAPSSACLTPWLNMSMGCFVFFWGWQRLILTAGAPPPSLSVSLSRAFGVTVYSSLFFFKCLGFNYVQRRACKLLF